MSVQTPCALAAAATVAFAYLASAAAANPAELLRRLDADRDGRLSAAEAGDEHRLLFDRLLRTSDEDRDAALDADEFAAALTVIRPERLAIEKQGSKLPGADALLFVIAKLDANGDGRLTRTEAPAEWTPVFERMLRQADGNEDQQLDERELARGAVRLGTVAQLAARRLGVDIEAELTKLPGQRRGQIEQLGGGARPGELLADPKSAAETFARLDANGDGQVAVDEVPAPFAERFEQMIERGDRNGDGRMSQREFVAIAERLVAAMQRPADQLASRRGVARLLQQFDRDGDGHLAWPEAPPRLAVIFQRADADGNGDLNGAELTRMVEMLQRLRPPGRSPNGQRRPRPPSGRPEINPPAEPENR